MKNENIKKIYKLKDRETDLYMNQIFVHRFNTNPLREALWSTCSRPTSVWNYNGYNFSTIGYLTAAIRNMLLDLTDNDLKKLDITNFDNFEKRFKIETVEVVTKIMFNKELHENVIDNCLLMYSIDKHIKHSYNIRNLCKKLIRDNKIYDYPYILELDEQITYRSEKYNELIDYIKNTIGITRNKYKWDRNVIAFTEDRHAMMAKLFMANDLKNYVNVKTIILKELNISE